MNSLPDSRFQGRPAVGGMEAGHAVGAGRYLLKRMLGAGGMGVVWLAHDKLLREAVALKFLPAQLAFDPAALEGLRRETLKARRLSHPHIVRIHDLHDRPDEPIFISMEYADGPNLHSLRAHRPGQVLSWKFLVPLLRQLCSALDYAHGERIIHRDIKPANLMLDGNGRLKLADFGLARVIADSLSRLSEQPQASGTLAYMSPQQADGKGPHVTDDIYSLGATLYELLSSVPPFHSGDISYQLRHQQPEPLQDRLAMLDLANNVPPGVCALILACLSKNPELRPQSARVILDWIDAAQNDAVPPSSSLPATPISDVTPAEPPCRADSNPSGTADDAFPQPAVQESESATGPTPSPAPAGSPRRRLGWMIWTAAVAAIVALGALYAIFNLRQHSRGPELHSSRQNRPPEFESLFNGRDLKGWHGDPTLWLVKDGAITAVTAEEGIKRRENSCLIWGATVEDFELRLSFRLVDVIGSKPANSGLFYRGRPIGNYQVRGYQADLHGEHAGTLLLLEGTLKDLRGEWGHALTLSETGGQLAFESTGVITPPDSFSRVVKTNDWNELVVIARGSHLIHKINGVVTQDVVDQSSYAPERSGVLALEMKRATNLQFKNIRLKKFPSTALAAGR